MNNPARLSFLTDLSVASRKMRTLFDAVVRKRGLTLSRARLLLHLARNGTATQTELAGLLDLENPTVVRLLDGLEKQGLITRSAVDGDRRAKQIALTEAARPEVVELDRLTTEMRDILLAEVSEADLATTSRVLAQLTLAIEAQTPAGREASA